MIVGLGNPGPRHAANRHNIGFMAVDRLASSYDIKFGRSRYKALQADGHIAGRPVILVKPQTYMNRSGDAVGPLAAYYRIAPENILVIYDELDLPLGTLRLREQGGTGGHNGMKSLVNHLGQGFPRLRLGIGRPVGRMDPAAYVLQDFSDDEKAVVREILQEAQQAVETFLREGIEMAMTRHNGSVLENDG
ncbi:MAG: aminoacyl-tRNA hydrolase [Chloroflexi bacterium]|nr:aminoacyl-tRNA hydrolase [Chloroflexota bacterium]